MKHDYFKENNTEFCKLHFKFMRMYKLLLLQILLINFIGLHGAEASKGGCIATSRIGGICSFEFSASNFSCTAGILDIGYEGELKSYKLDYPSHDWQKQVVDFKNFLSQLKSMDTSVISIYDSLFLAIGQNDLKKYQNFAKILEDSFDELSKKDFIKLKKWLYQKRNTGMLKE